MNKRKVYFKADASSEIGYGHFIRTLALADMLKYDFDCHFFTSNPNDFQIEEVAKVCKLHSLDFETATSTFLHLLKGNEIVVLDNYYYSAEYQKQIKDKGCKLVCIDDIADRYFYADVVINHASGVKQESYQHEKYTKLCLGTDYLLLRKAFIEAIRNPLQVVRDSIFICFGGSDENNFTLQSCKALRKLDERHIITVVGGGYTFASELKEYADNHNVSVYSNIDAAKMIRLMSSSVFAIVPASTTFFEMCCARVPIITGYTVENQVNIAAGCSRLGLGYNCGNFLDNFETKIASAYKNVNSTGNDYIHKQQHLIKDSSINLVKVFKDLC